MIPGYRFHTYELYGNIRNTNNQVYNPYDPDNNINLIGNLIDNQEENNAIWNEISEHLVRCRYKTPNEIEPAKPSELNIFSYNIRSAHKNLQHIIDNASDYQKYDVLCINETNCDIGKLANGLQDLIIEGFHPPVYQAPARASCKGGGLMTYVNIGICSADEVEKIDLGIEPSTDGEFLFIKIKSCKGYNGTVIVGNVYRSPSRKNCSAFIELYENVLGKIHRHNNKLVTISGDFNIDLIKYNSDGNIQNLIDIASNHGFIQVISRPTRVTDHSATLIDHVYTNRINNVVNSSVVTLDITDHLATCVTISLDRTFDRLQIPTTGQDNTEQYQYRY